MWPIFLYTYPCIWSDLYCFLCHRNTSGIKFYNNSIVPHHSQAIYLPNREM